MALPYPLLLVGLALTIGLLYAIHILVLQPRKDPSTSSSLPEPPGPPRLPIIGNLHQIPKTGAHRQFTRWAATYGGILSLRLGPTPAVVLTDRRLVRELLDRKSALYSSRPPSHVSHDLITRGDHMLVMQYGALWRTFRRAVHRFLAEASVDHAATLALVNAEEVAWAHNLLERPGGHLEAARRASNSIIMSLVFGVRTPIAAARHMTDLYALMERWSAVMETGATPPVDMFPWLKRVPEAWLGNWVRRSLDVGARMKALYAGERVRMEARQKKNEHAVRPFLQQVLDEQDALQLTENQQDFLGGVLMEGGSDTVSTMMLVVLQALVLHPEVVRRAQAAIDAVVGEDRTPVWADRAALPYVTQIVKEAIRWRPVTPLAFPHALVSDKGDIVDGRFALAPGTTVFLNVWGLHHDCADPDAFNPDRFDGRTRTSAEYAAAADYALRDHYVFGAGRRICPGIHLAEREMFLATAKLLWGFDLVQARDAQGNVIPIDTDPVTGYTEGFLVCPKPFECKITPRSEKRAATIHREYTQAERDVFSRYN